MNYEKLLRDFMDSKRKSRDYRNTKLYTDHIHMHVYSTGKADKQSWLK